MKNYIKIYMFLALFLSLQVFFMSKVSFFPDLALILVVYTGIFYGLTDTLVLGAAAGLLRGLLSQETLPVDLVIFPMVGSISLYVGRLFNRNNPLGGVFISFVSMLFVVVFQTLWLSRSYGSDIGILTVLLADWKVIILTVITFPFIYFLLNSFLREDSYRPVGRRIYY